MRKIRIRRKTWTLISAILMLAGIAMYMYPRIANLITQEYTATAITSFKATVKTMENKENMKTLQEEETNQEAIGVVARKEESLLDKLLEKAERYNQRLYAEGQKDLVDPFSYEMSSIDLSEYGIADAMFGYIEIPKLNITLGIYLGATAEHMSKGAVHLTQTSLPIGGDHTNAVIAAHRGSRYGEMFRNIDKLEIGDEVIITNAWETLFYTVTSIEIIAPNEIDKVLIQENKDMVTLLSCNPYGKNIQRYVVYCDRIVQD